jgi:hypothetical protein
MASMFIDGTRVETITSGLRVCITGTLSVKRSTVEDLLWRTGFIVVDSISNATSVLLMGSNPGTIKARNASYYNTIIYQERQFMSSLIFPFIQNGLLILDFQGLSYELNRPNSRISIDARSAQAQSFDVSSYTSSSIPVQYLAATMATVSYRIEDVFKDNNKQQEAITEEKMDTRIQRSSFDMSDFFEEEK